MASPIVRIDTRSGDFSIGSILQTDAGQTQIEPVDMHIQAKEDPYRYHNSTNRAWTRCKVDFSKKKKYKMTRSQLSHKEYKRHKHNSLIPAIINAFSYISKKGRNGISLHDHYQAQSNCTFSSSPIISSNCGQRNQII